MQLKKKIIVVLIGTALLLLIIAVTFGYIRAKAPQRSAAAFISAYYTSDEACYATYTSALTVELASLAKAAKENPQPLGLSAISQEVFESYTRKFSPLVDEGCLQKLYANGQLPAIDDYAFKQQLAIKPQQVKLSFISHTHHAVDNVLVHQYKFEVSFPISTKLSNATGTLSIANDKVTAFTILSNPFLSD